MELIIVWYFPVRNYIITVANNLKKSRCLSSG
jgi:hypothetical protein